MNVKKTIKKIVALGAGATMVGATMMGATAALEDYPGMWIQDGAFDGKIVVGQDAATSDVLGAIDIAASLQAASTVSTDVDVPGAAGKTTLTGDAVEIAESNDLLELNEPIGDVRDSLTEYDIGALKGGVISTDQGTTAYKQYLRFKTSASFNASATGNAMFPTAVVFGDNGEDEVSDWLFIAEDNSVDGGAFFEWEIEFEEGLEAEIEGSSAPYELKDLEDEVFNIFGTDFVFVDSELRNNTAAGSTEDLKLEFIAGDVTDVLQEGETKTYTIDGKDYEVTLVFVSNPNDGTVEAKLSVNGELTDALTDGDTDILSDGLEIGIQEILVSERGGVVEFFLGAQKISFRDQDTGDSDYEAGVEVTQETIEEGYVSIRGQIIGGNALDAGEEYEITNIKYRLTADALTGMDDLYIPPGHGVREFLDEPAGLLSPSFDIRYEGIMEVSETPIELVSQGDDEYQIRATNRRGNTYSIPYVEVTSANVFRLGEDTDEGLHFIEPDLSAIDDGNASTTVAAGDFVIAKDDKFVVWDEDGATAGSADDGWDEDAYSQVLEYQSIDTSQNVLTFEDLATGTKELTYTSFSGNTTDAGSNFLGEGDLIVGGTAYQVYVSSATGNPIAVDLNADGEIEGDKGKFVVQGGGIIDFDAEAATPDTVSAGEVHLKIRTQASEFDETDKGNEELLFNVSMDSQNEVTTSFVNYTRTDVGSAYGGGALDRSTNVLIDGLGSVATTGNFEGFQFELQEPDDNEDHEMEMTDYGVTVDLYTPSNSPEELTLGYPSQQRGAQVFVTAGEVTATSGGPGGVTTTQVNPIAVGLAVLDVDAPAVGTENMIAVGGPCINSVSAELLGLSYPSCGEAAADAGFEDGMATIRLFESQNAIVVAGYTAQDTLGASYVLADYDDYDLMGDEVEVVVADLDTITVNPVN